MTLGEKIRSARLEQKLTQEQLAGRELTKSYISELERGSRSPRLTTLKILAHRLNRPLSYFRDGASEEREPEVFLMVGLARLHSGAWPEAQAAMERALELATQQEDEALQIRIEMSLAAVEHHAGRSTQAFRRINRCIHTLSRKGNPLSLARAQLSLGRLRLHARDASSAVWAFEAALRLANQAPHDPALLADLHIGLGDAFLQLGRTEEALDAFRAALAVAEPYRDPAQVAGRHLELAVSAVDEGHFDEAAGQAGKALAVYDTIAHKRRLAEIHRALGEAAVSGDRWDEAERHFRWSVALQCAVAQWPGAAEVLGTLAEAVLARAVPDAARAAAEMALGLLTADGDHRDPCRSLRVRGAVCRFLGRREEARGALEECLTALERTGRHHDASLVRLELALLAIEMRDLTAARYHLEMLRGGTPPRRSASGL